MRTYGPDMETTAYVKATPAKAEDRIDNDEQASKLTIFMVEFL